MAENSSPEYQAFKKNFEVLLNLRHGIETISSKAYAAGLICKDVRSKCSNKSLTEAERAKAFLEELEGKLQYVPKTLQRLVELFKETDSFGYIAERLLKSLEEEEKHFSYTVPTAATLPGNSSWIAGKQDATTTATTCPGHSSVIDGDRETTTTLPGNFGTIAATSPGNSSMLAGGWDATATFPGNTNRVAGGRDAGDTLTHRIGSLDISGSSVHHFNGQDEGAELPARSTTQTLKCLPGRLTPSSLSLEAQKTLSSHQDSVVHPQPERGAKSPHTSSISAANGSRRGQLHEQEKGAHRQRVNMKVVIKDATPIKDSQARNLEFQDMTDSSQDAQRPRAASFGSIASSDSGDYNTPSLLLDERDLWGGDTDNAKDQCQNCALLQKTVSRLKEKNKKFKKQLDDCDEQMEMQESKLQENKETLRAMESELHWTEMELEKSLSKQHQTEKQLDRAALQLGRAEMINSQVVMGAEHLLQAIKIQNSSSPSQEILTTPTHPPPTTTTQQEDHTHLDHTHPHTQMTAGGFPLAQNTSGGDLKKNTTGPKHCGPEKPTTIAIPQSKSVEDGTGEEGGEEGGRGTSRTRFVF